MTTISDSNPQGKGLVPIMDMLLVHRHFVNIPAKKIEQITAELFTSLFILQSEFKFRIVTNRSYWLYRNQETFRLSIIHPREWKNSSFGEFVGECILQNDLTWTLILSEQAAQDEELIDYINSEKTAFKKQLLQQTQLTQALPVYEANLPFYQRALANGLACSLKISMVKSQILQLDFKSALTSSNKGIPLQIDDWEVK